MLSSIKNPDEKTSGIYMLYCVANKKAYIGQSVNMWRRYGTHRSTLTNPKMAIERSANPALLKDWKEFGRRFFIFLVLEYCSPEQLLERERYYIDLIDKKYLYNILDVWTGRKHREESKSKMSIALKGRRRSKQSLENARIIAASKPSRSKLTAEKAFDIKIRLLKGEDIFSIAKLYNVNHCTIKDIRDGRSWKYISHTDGSCIYPKEDNLHLIIRFLQIR